MRSVSGTNGPPTAAGAAPARLAVDAEIGEHAAHALGLGVVALLERVERRGLPRFDAIERGLQARQRALDADGRRSWRRAATRLATAGSTRDSSRASRSGGAVKITVSLIGEGLSGVARRAARAIGAGRALIEPVGVGSGTPASVEARDSSVAWRRTICSSFCSNCSWSSNWRLAMRSTWARSSAMRSS